MELVQLRMGADGAVWTDGAAVQGAPPPVPPLPSLWVVGDGLRDLAEHGRHERAIAALFGDWLTEHFGGLADRAAERARRRGVPLVLHVLGDDARPWELLGADPRFADWQVVRGGEAADAAVEPDPPLELRPMDGPARIASIWAAEPEDPEVRRLVEAVGLPPAGLVHLVVSAPRTGPLDEAATRALRRARLVLLDLLGRSGRLVAGELPAELLGAGAAAVLAPASVLEPSASIAVAGVLDRMLRGDATLVEVAAAARAMLQARGLAGAWPWALRLYVADPGVLAVRSGLRPAWPPGSPEGERVLGQALVAARRAGWLGVEQLARALAQHPEVGPYAEGLRTVASMAPPVEGGGVSTRVLSLPLGPGWGPADLLRALVSVPWVGGCFEPRTLARLLAWVAARGGPPASFGGPPPHPGWAIEVLGGPEDGRLLLPRVGESIGRADPDLPGRAETRTGFGAADPELSRRHLRVVDEEQVEILAPTWDFALRPLSGILPWGRGARLKLGGTWMMRR